MTGPSQPKQFDPCQSRRGNEATNLRRTIHVAMAQARLGSDSRDLVDTRAFTMKPPCNCIVVNGRKETCDYCNGYQHHEAKELFCPRIMNAVAEQLGVHRTDLMSMTADEIRSSVDTSEYVAELRERYPAATAE